MQQPKPNRIVLCYILVAALALALLLFGSSAPTNAMLHAKTNLENINDGWCLAQGKEWLSLGDVSHYHSHASTITIQRTLPEHITTQHLLFYTAHQQVSVAIDGLTCYRHTIPDGFDFLKTPGNTWHSIALTPADGGKTVSITFTCPFSVYQTLPSDIFFLPQGTLQIAQACSIWFCNTVAIFMLVLGAISFASGSFWKNALLKTYTLRLGTLYILIALWLFTEINLANLVLRNSITTYLFSMLLIRLLPLSVYHFLQTTAPNHTPLAKYIAWVLIANIFIPFLLQFALSISLLDTLVFTYLLTIVGIGYAFIGMLRQGFKLWRTHRAPTLYHALYFCSSLLLLGALGEIYCYAHYATFGFLRGVSLSVTTIIYTIIARIILVRLETQFEQETHTLTRKNNKLQLMPLTQQINAHFLLNTLNNISFLCKKDPIAADRSVILLAQYMREFMFLVNTSELIPFAREHALMDAYLQIQQIRFGDKISFFLDTDGLDFYLPPLCIQPFVENAILHGVRGKKDGGTITIAHTQEGKFVKITVQDNGVGFDTAALQDTTHVGIQNAQKRLGLYGGHVTITSTTQGTTVDIFVLRQSTPFAATP